MEAKNEWYGTVGDVLGAGAAIIAFLAIYAAAVASVGWVIGIALGWVAAGLAAWIAYALVRALWLWVLIAIGLVVLNAFVH